MKIWFTLTGTNHYHGQDFLKKGMKVRLEKEPDNRHDHEAIKVLMDGVGLIGYVANSPWTVIGESFSAGRLYDKIGDTATATVAYVMVDAKKAVCKVDLPKPESETSEDD